MGRRYKSDFPSRGFDRSCSRGFDFGWKLLLSATALGFYAFRENATSELSTNGTYCCNRPIRYRELIPQKPNPKEYTEEIQRLESSIKNNIITLKQCEYLAGIYNTLQDYHNEKRIRVIALELFLKECEEETKFTEIITAFNDPCKQPPDSICDNELINEDYRLLLKKAEIAKKKSYKFKKLHRL